MDELNLYDDLEEFQEQQERKSKELQDLEEKNQQSLKTIDELRKENHALKKNIAKMEVGFQSLLDTARAEIHRKDKEIDRLRKEIDDICFRRATANKSVNVTKNTQFAHKSVVKNSARCSTIKNDTSSTETTCKLAITGESPQLDRNSSLSTQNTTKDNEIPTEELKASQYKVKIPEPETKKRSREKFEGDHTLDYKRFRSSRDKDDKYYNERESSYKNLKDGSCSRGRYREDFKDTTPKKIHNRNRSRERKDYNNTSSRNTHEKYSKTSDSTERYCKGSDRDLHRVREKPDKSKASLRSPPSKSKYHSVSIHDNHKNEKALGKTEAGKSPKYRGKDLCGQKSNQLKSEHKNKTTAKPHKEKTGKNLSYKSNSAGNKVSIPTKHVPKEAVNKSLGIVLKDDQNNKFDKDEIEECDISTCLDVSKMSSLHEVALLNEIFGKSPNDSSTTLTKFTKSNSIANNFGSRIRKTLEIVVISSATTLPGCYGDIRRCKSATNGNIVEITNSTNNTSDSIISVNNVQSIANGVEKKYKDKDSVEDCFFPIYDMEVNVDTISYDDLAKFSYTTFNTLPTIQEETGEKACDQNNTEGLDLDIEYCKILDTENCKTANENHMPLTMKSPVIIEELSNISTEQGNGKNITKSNESLGEVTNITLSSEEEDTVNLVQSFKMKENISLKNPYNADNSLQELKHLEKVADENLNIIETQESSVAERILNSDQLKETEIESEIKAQTDNEIQSQKDSINLKVSSDDSTSIDKSENLSTETTYSSKLNLHSNNISSIVKESSSVDSQSKEKDNASAFNETLSQNISSSIEEEKTLNKENLDVFEEPTTESKVMQIRKDNIVSDASCNLEENTSFDTVCTATTASQEGESISKTALDEIKESSITETSTQENSLQILSEKVSANTKQETLTNVSQESHHKDEAVAVEEKDEIVEEICEQNSSNQIMKNKENQCESKTLAQENTLEANTIRESDHLKLIENAEETQHVSSNDFPTEFTQDTKINLSQKLLKRIHSQLVKGGSEVKSQEFLADEESKSNDNEHSKTNIISAEVLVEDKTVKCASESESNTSISISYHSLILDTNKDDTDTSILNSLSKEQTNIKTTESDIVAVTSNDETGINSHKESNIESVVEKTSQHNLVTDSEIRTLESQDLSALSLNKCLEKNDMADDIPKELNGNNSIEACHIGSSTSVYLDLEEKSSITVLSIPKELKSNNPIEGCHVSSSTSIYLDLEEKSPIIALSKQIDFETETQTENNLQDAEITPRVSPALETIKEVDAQKNKETNALHDFNERQDILIDNADKNPESLNKLINLNNVQPKMDESTKKSNDNINKSHLDQHHVAKENVFTSVSEAIPRTCAETSQSKNLINVGSQLVEICPLNSETTTKVTRNCEKSEDFKDLNNESDKPVEINSNQPNESDNSMCPSRDAEKDLKTFEKEFTNIIADQSESESNFVAPSKNSVDAVPSLITKTNEIETLVGPKENQKSSAESIETREAQIRKCTTNQVENPNNSNNKEITNLIQIKGNDTLKTLASIDKNPEINVLTTEVDVVDKTESGIKPHDSQNYLTANKLTNTEGLTAHNAEVKQSNVKNCAESLNLEQSMDRTNSKAKSCFNESNTVISELKKLDEALEVINIDSNNMNSILPLNKNLETNDLNANVNSDPIECLPQVKENVLLKKIITKEINIEGEIVEVIKDVIDVIEYPNSTQNTDRSQLNNEISNKIQGDLQTSNQRDNSIVNIDTNEKILLTETKPASQENIALAKKEIQLQTTQDQLSAMPGLNVSLPLVSKNISEIPHIIPILPSIFTTTPTPSNFSGLFTKRAASAVTITTEDEFIKTKKKSAYYSVKPKEYILPAASVLCNADNLENATKSNKKLHWELLDNKNEYTEIEDDADVDTTDDEQLKSKKKALESSSSVKKQLSSQNKCTDHILEISSSSETDTLTEGESLSNNLREEKKKSKKFNQSKVRKITLRNCNLPKNMKAKLKLVQRSNVEAALMDNNNLLKQKPLPKRPVGRPRKHDNQTHKNNAGVTVLHKKRGRKPKLRIENTETQQEFKKLNVCKESRFKVKDVDVGEAKTTSFNNLEPLYIEQKVSYIDKCKGAATAFVKISKSNKDNCFESCNESLNDNKIMDNIEVSMKILSTSVEKLEIGDEPCNLKDSFKQRNIFETQIENHGKEDALDSSIIYHHKDSLTDGMKSSTTNEPITECNKQSTEKETNKMKNTQDIEIINANNCDKISVSVNRTELLMGENKNLDKPVNSSDIETFSKHNQVIALEENDSSNHVVVNPDVLASVKSSDTKIDKSLKPKSAKITLFKKQFKSKLIRNRIPNFVSLQDIGIKVRPLKTHLSSFRIPKIKKVPENIINDSWKLESYEELANEAEGSFGDKQIFQDKRYCEGKVKPPINNTTKEHNTGTKNIEPKFNNNIKTIIIEESESVSSKNTDNETKTGRRKLFSADLYDEVNNKTATENTSKEIKLHSKSSLQETNVDSCETTSKILHERPTSSHRRILDSSCDESHIDDNNSINIKLSTNETSESSKLETSFGKTLPIVSNKDEIKEQNTAKTKISKASSHHQTVNLKLTEKVNNKNDRPQPVETMKSLKMRRKSMYAESISFRRFSTELEKTPNKPYTKLSNQKSPKKTKIQYSGMQNTKGAKSLQAERNSSLHFEEEKTYATGTKKFNILLEKNVDSSITHRNSNKELSSPSHIPVALIQQNKIKRRRKSTNTSSHLCADGESINTQDCRKQEHFKDGLKISYSQSKRKSSDSSVASTHKVSKSRRQSLDTNLWSNREENTNSKEVKKHRKEPEEKLRFDIENSDKNVKVKQQTVSTFKKSINQRQEPKLHNNEVDRVISKKVFKHLKHKSKDSNSQHEELSFYTETVKETPIKIRRKSTNQRLTLNTSAFDQEESGETENMSDHMLKKLPEKSNIIVIKKQDDPRKSFKELNDQVTENLDEEKQKIEVCRNSENQPHDSQSNSAHNSSLNQEIEMCWDEPKIKSPESHENESTKLDSSPRMESDVDYSALWPQQKAIERSTTTEYQRRIPDCNSESDEEPPIKKPFTVSIAVETPLNVAGKPKGRRRRVVKVLSTSNDSSAAVINTPPKSTSESSPLSSLLLNHPIFNTEESMQNIEFAASLPTTPNQEDDNKFKEIDSKLHEIFQSPQYAVDYTSSSTLVASNTTFVILPLGNTQSNITVDETVDPSQKNIQNSLNTSEAGESMSSINLTGTTGNNSEIKHLSLGAADYRFEKVSDNVINLFISRKRKRKRNN